jgi:hypothetical protein
MLEVRVEPDAFPDRYLLMVDGKSDHGRMLTGGRKKASGPLVLKHLGDLQFEIHARGHRLIFSERSRAVTACPADGRRICACSNRDRTDERAAFLEDEDPGGPLLEPRVT